MKAWADIGRTVEVKQTPEKEQNRLSEGLGRGQSVGDSRERSVMVGQVPKGINLY